MGAVILLVASNRLRVGRRVDRLAIMTSAAALWLVIGFWLGCAVTVAMAHVKQRCR
jgi:hypothetical protein